MTDAPSPRFADRSDLVAAYLRELRRGLHGLPSEEVDDIVREIGSHLTETSGDAADPERVRAALGSLGSASDLAARYRTELQLERAAGGFSPFTMMHALVQWASLSVYGFATAVVGMVGYALGFALMLAAVVKPIVREVGLWVGPGTLVIGHTDDPQARELLGWWLVPIGLIGGLAVVIVTSRLLRLMIRGHRSHRSRRSTTAVLIALALVAWPALPAAAKPTDFRAQIEQVLDEEGVPGASIALIRADGRIESYGVGDADVQHGVAVTPSTRFRAGSITKSFTAVLIMQLVAEGKLDLDRPLSEIAPEIAVNNPWRDDHPVLVRHLLQHSTGFDDIKISESWTLDETRTRLPLKGVLALREAPLESRFAPGTLTSYSNPGYTILGSLAEMVTGERYEDLVRRRIFEPLGMTGASLEVDALDSDTASGYTAYDDVAFPPYRILHRPAGSLVVSAGELARFARALARRGAFDGGRLLPAHLVEEMESSQADLPMAAGFTVGYGMGIHSDLRHPVVMYGHDGGMPGFMGSYAYHRDEGFGFVVLINAISPSALKRIGRLAFDEVAGPRDLPRFTAPPAEELDSWTGHYRLMTYRPELAAPIVRLVDRVDLAIENGALLEQKAFGDDRALVPAEDGSWRRDTDPVGTRRLFVDDRGRRWLLTPFDAYLEADPRVWRLELGLTAALAVGSLLPVVWAPVWALMWLRRRRTGAAPPAFPLWPVAASSCLLIALVAPGFIRWMTLTTVNPWTLILALGSGGFGILAMVGVIRALATKPTGRPGFWLVSQLGPACVQVALAGYLWYWGLLGLRLWEA